MKLDLRIYSLLFLTTLTPSAFAGAGPSNGGGGNALVCFTSTAIADQVRNSGHQVTDAMIQNHQVTSIESVDLHEALLPEGFDGAKAQVIPLLASATFEADLEKIATRFDTSVPRLGQFIREGIDAFDGANTRLEDNGIPYMNDANLQVNFDHDNCTLVTLALQEQIGTSSILRIDNRLFSNSLHSNQSRAILLLHEMIYREARLLGQKDSRNTRLLLGAMINQNSESNNPTGTVWGMIKYAHDLGFLSLSVSETYLEQFRIKLGQMAVQQAWQYFLDYSYQNSEKALGDLLTPLFGGSSDPTSKGTLYSTVIDGNYYLFNPLDAASGYHTDSAITGIANAKTLFNAYDQGRDKFIWNSMNDYAKTLVTQVQSTIKNVPQKDLEILEDCASNVFAPSSMYASSYILVAGANTPGSMRGCMNLLHFLSKPSDFGATVKQNKETYVDMEDGVAQSNSYTIAGVDGVTYPSSNMLSSQEFGNQTGSPSTSLVIDLQEVYRGTAGVTSFTDAANEFNYPLPTLN